MPVVREVFEGGRGGMAAEVACGQRVSVVVNVKRRARGSISVGSWWLVRF
jgi:hypothetical protein